MIKYFKICILAFISLFVCSCSQVDYRNAMPADCHAVVSIDFTQKTVADRLSFLKTMFSVNNVADCGIDLSKKVYLFSSVDGNLGVCARVSDGNDLSALAHKIVKEGMAEEIIERENADFIVIDGKWVCGWNENALLIMGPTLSASHSALIQKMCEMLTFNEENGIAGTPMMEKMDKLEGQLAMVARSTSLPEKFVSLVALGMPKDADLSNMYIAATMTFGEDMLHIKGEPLSFNNDIDKKLKSSYGIFRQIGDSYLKCLDSHSPLGFFINVDGKKFLPLLQQSETLQMLLAGVNQAVDMNNIIKSVNGDMYVCMPDFNGTKADISLAAHLGNSQFLNDVNYWKTSVPAGFQLSDWKKNAYVLSSSETNFYFGVTEYTPLEFYSGTTKELAEKSIKPAENQLSQPVIDTIKGSRLAVVFNIAALLPDDAGMAMLVLPGKIGVHSVVYTVE